MKPNIVYIFADDMGYGDLACQNGGSRIPTPNMDAIAAAGIRFSDAHASSGVCTPSRYSVMTGRYCWRGRLKKGVLTGYSPSLIEAGRTTVASLLGRQGYHTACVGKWHLGWDWVKREGVDEPGKDDLSRGVDFTKPIVNGPRTFGFDWFFGISASLDMAPYCYVENELPTATPDRVIEGSSYNAFYRPGPISPDFAHVEVLPSLTAKAVEYVRERGEAGQPFFLYFPLPAPHTPVLPTEEFQGKSGAGDYGDFVMQCDDTIGQIMAALDEIGQADNTLLIFTSDNGPETIAYERAREYEHFSMGELRGIKRDTWEGGHRVPFIARWPGQISPGTVCGETICLTDLMATVADITGATLPEDAGEDSVSILPALRGAPLGETGREAIVHHSAGGEFAIRQGDWVLIDAPSGQCSKEPDWFKALRGYQPHDHPGELFNLADDRAEANNLYADRPEIVERLRTLLEECKTVGRSVSAR